MSQNPIDNRLNVLTRYHYYVFFLLFLSKVPIFWHILNLIFLSPPMKYSCTAARTNETNQCPCDNPKWDRSVFTETMQTKFGIYCDNIWLISFSQSMAYAGALVGSFSFGSLSDRFGRLSTFSASCLIIAIAGCLVSVMPTAPSFICMRFIEGIGVGGAIVTSFVLCIEYCGVKYRETVTALFHIPVNLGHVCIPGISYILRDFDDFQLAISIPMFFFASLNWLMMESPKWLMDNDHVEKAASVMEKLSHLNSTADIQEEIRTYLETAKKTQRTLKFWEIFKHRKLVVNFLCMSFMYFVCGMGYYGVSQYIGEMSGNIHVNVALSGLLLLPGTLVCTCLLKVLGRRPFLMSTNFLAGIFMLVVICTPSHLNWVRVIFACISNSFFFMSFIIAFLYGVELFPTSVRNSVLGLLSVLSRLGQIVNPPINALSQFTAGITFGVMAIIAGFLCCFLPETKDIELPSWLEDSKGLTRHRQSSQASTSGQAKAPAIAAAK